MIHPDTELRFVGPEIGYGVFARRRIPCGTIVWVIDDLDMRFTLAEVRAKPPAVRRLLDHYGLLHHSGLRIVPWDFGRFVNHACDPNVLPTAWDFEIAVRDIEAGEQLTNDYATLNLERPFRCHCGGGVCRGRVRPGDFEPLVRGWDEEVRRCLPDLLRVEQPLWEYVRRPAVVRRSIVSAGPIPSVERNRFGPAREDPLAYAAVPGRRARGRLKASPVAAPPPRPAVARSAPSRA